MASSKDSISSIAYQGGWEALAKEKPGIVLEASAVREFLKARTIDGLDRAICILQRDDMLDMLGLEVKLSDREQDDLLVELKEIVGKEKIVGCDGSHASFLAQASLIRNLVKMGILNEDSGS